MERFISLPHERGAVVIFGVLSSPVYFPQVIRWIVASSYIYHNTSWSLHMAVREIFWVSRVAVHLVSRRMTPYCLDAVP